MQMDEITGPIHTTLEKLEKRVFFLKTNQMFSVNTTLEKCKNATITVMLNHVRFLFEENFRQGNQMIIVFEKLLLQNDFGPH